jgi:hypothetical protein
MRLARAEVKYGRQLKKGENGNTQKIFFLYIRSIIEVHIDLIQSKCFACRTT